MKKAEHTLDRIFLGLAKMVVIMTYCNINILYSFNIDTNIFKLMYE